jgi:hypothetical protein
VILAMKNLIVPRWTLLSFPIVKRVVFSASAPPLAALIESYSAMVVPCVIIFVQFLTVMRVRVMVDCSDLARARAYCTGKSGKNTGSTVQYTVPYRYTVSYNLTIQKRVGVGSIRSIR